ncbi:MAG: TonB-dependent receptor [Treponema sp.]|nr:TonB-dependent receptor [Treponema sp.]
MKRQSSYLKIFFLLIISFFISPYIFAQELEEDSFEDFDEDVISVSAEKISQTINSEVEQKQVISDEDIRKTGSKTVGEALKELPGINVSNATAGNANESITLQGLGSGYVKIMIDGVTVATDLTGSTPIFQIPVENVDHIEVIKGADAVLYGSEAMGGVINVITKQDTSDKAAAVSGNLTEEFGFSPVIMDWKNYLAASLFTGGRNFSNSLIASFDYNPGKKESCADALAGSITYYKNTKKLLGFARDTFAWRHDRGNLSLYGLYTDSFQVSNFTKTGYDKGSDMEYRSLRGEAGLTTKYNFTEKFYLDGFTVGKLYYLNTKYNVKAGPFSSSKGTESNSIDWESDLRSYWNPNDFNNVIIGANVNLESIDGSSFDNRKMALETAIFGQDTIFLCNKILSIVPGIRLDFSPSIQDSAVNFMATPKLLFKFSPDEKTAIRTSYAMGYKIPSLQEKYWIFKHNYAPGSGNFILYGNPNLLPEQSHSFNIGWEQNLADILKFNIDGFYNYIVNLIDSIVIDSASSPQIREYQNIDEAITYGGELSISSDLDRFKAKLGYAYTGALFYNQATSSWDSLALRVKHRITASTEYQIPVIETLISLNAQWNSPQLLSVGTDYYTPDFLMLGVDISKKLCEEKVTVYLGADNILNNFHFIKGSNGENQRDYYGLNEGFTLRIGTKVQL